MDRPMKVVRIVTRLNVGGPTRHISILTEHLPRHRIDGITVTGPTPAGEGDGELRVSGQVIEVPTLGRAVSIWDDLRAFVALVRLLRRERPDVVHTHQSKAGFLGRWAAWVTRVPRVVHTFHGFTFRGYFGALGSFLVAKLEQVTLLVTDVVICQDPLQQDELVLTLGDGARKRCRIIAPSVSIPDRSDVPQAEPPRLVFPARLVPIKDPNLVLEVLKKLDPAIELDVVGDGIMMPQLRARVAADPTLRSRVHFHGNLADPWDIYQRATVGLLTSIAEGTPLALLELQILGTRVVAPDVGGVRGVVDLRCGEVVGRSVDALAQAVVRQLREVRISSSVRRDLSVRYDGLRLASQVADIYRKTSRLGGDFVA